MTIAWSAKERVFDTVYPMLGARARSDIIRALGADVDEAGELKVDDHQRTSIPGLYAAGDLVKALNQMTVGTAHAAIAATRPSIMICRKTRVEPVHNARRASSNSPGTG